MPLAGFESYKMSIYCLIIESNNVFTKRRQQQLPSADAVCGRNRCELCVFWNEVPKYHKRTNWERIANVLAVMTSVCQLVHHSIEFNSRQLLLFGSNTIFCSLTLFGFQFAINCYWNWN